MLCPVVNLQGFYYEQVNHRAVTAAHRPSTNVPDVTVTFLALFYWGFALNAALVLLLNSKLLMLTCVSPKWADYYLMYLSNQRNNCRSTQRVFESRTSDQCLMFKKKNKKVKRIQIKKILGCRQQNSWTYLKQFVFQVFSFIYIYIYDFASLFELDAVALWYWKESMNFHCQ